MSDIRKIYSTEFNGSAYAKEYLGESTYEMQWWPEEFYHQLFSEGKMKGKTLIDVGSGPSVRAALIASAYVPEITNAEFLESNRILAGKWLQNKPGAPNYTAQFKHVAQLEGKNDIKYLEHRVRKAIKQVIPCDILADNPLDPRPMEQFDIVTSSYLLDAFSDERDYTKAAQNLVKLIKHGGYLAIIGALDCTNYIVGGVKLPASNTTGQTIRKIFTDAGLKVLEFEERRAQMQLDIETDSKGSFVLFATKI